MTSLLNALARKLRDRVSRRHPDVCIGGDGTPAACYMQRWFVWPRNRFCNLYLHKFQHDDDDRALHDHPWANVTYVVEGRYRELTPRGAFVRMAGHFAARLATSAHRVELLDSRPCWSLFLTGPVVRGWGFHCPRGWVDYKTFTGQDHNKTGKYDHRLSRGCGEMDA